MHYVYFNFAASSVWVLFLTVPPLFTLSVYLIFYIQNTPLTSDAIQYNSSDKNVQFWLTLSQRCSFNSTFIIEVVISGGVALDCFISLSSILPPCMCVNPGVGKTLNTSLKNPSFQESKETSSNISVYSKRYSIYNDIKERKILTLERLKPENTLCICIKIDLRRLSE